MNENHPPLIALRDSDQKIFEDVRAYLIESLAKLKYSEPESSSGVGTSAEKILNHLDAGETEDAYEILYSLVPNNNLSDVLFLGLSLTNYDLNYLEAAGKYASQARHLHQAVGDGEALELLGLYAETLGHIVEEWKNSKIIVNDRFVHLYPNETQLEQTNAVDKYIMQGLAPKKPFITKSDQIATIGSCFTGNISTFLRHNGFNVPVLNTDYAGNLPTGSFSDEVFNTYILRYLFELAFGDETIEGDDYNVVNQHNVKTTFSIDDIKTTLANSTVFIITLGLSEVWFSKRTGEVYKTAKSVGEYDEELHDFRVTNVQENFDNLNYVYQAIRRNVKDAAIIFTLSPVPLKATFRDIGCIPANSVSKAILRVALEELLTTHGDDDGLHYFPSYELILDCLPKPFGPDRRYVNADTVNFAMTLFANHYIVHDKQLTLLGTGAVQP